MPGADEVDVAGRFEGDRHVLPVRVYYEDTDFSGIVYHGAFVRFLERGRSDLLRLRGVDHRALAAGVHGEAMFFALVSLTLSFRAPGRIDDLLEVTTRPAAAGAARIVMDQTVRRAGTVLVTGRAELCLIGPDGRPRRPPPAVRAILASSLRTGGKGGSPSTR